MSIEWFRWYHNTASDPKFQVIARRSKRPKCEVIAVWACLLEYTSQEQDRGSLAGLDHETIAATVDIDDESAEAIIAAMEAKGLISDGRIAAWERRQPKREDDSRDRVRAYRERKKEIGNASVTQGNAPVTPVTPLDKIRVDKDKDMEEVVETLAPARVATDKPERPAAASDLNKKIEKLPVPLTEILSEYHRILPDCIPCHVPTERMIDQIAHLSAPDTDQLPILDCWSAYFRVVAKSPLLCGRAPPKDGYPTPFVADLEWLTRFDNFMRVAYENRYTKPAARGDAHVRH